MKFSQCQLKKIFILTPLLILASLTLTQCSPTSHKPTSLIPIESSPKRINVSESLSKPYVLLVSLDGFRHDYIEKYNAINIADIEKHGRRAQGLIPSYPTKTFPNHYSIVTGMLPTTHGLVDNEFYDAKTKKRYTMSDPFAVRDGSWYGGDPIWSVAERSGMLAASYFWVGSEAQINGYRPNYYLNYDSTHENKLRVEQIETWLRLPESERPHLLTLYFSIVDNAGHKFGPDAKETGESVREADELIGLLRKKIESLHLPINLILVSDHGMGALDNSHAIELSNLIELNKFEVSGGGTFVSLHSDNKKNLEEAYHKLKSMKHARAYCRNEIPPQYKLKSIDRIGNIVVIAENSYYILTKPIKDPNNPFNQKATHGWSNSFKDMHGIFLAEGPNIKAGPRLPAFENIHIYPLVLKILGLKTGQKIDGNDGVLKSVYKP